VVDDFLLTPRQFGPSVTLVADPRGVATLRLVCPPHNYIEAQHVRALATALEAADDRGARAIVLATEGRNFCAGASLQSKLGGGVSFEMYDDIPRLFRTAKPIVAVVQGSAVGAGLGLALVADFRVVAASTKFVAPFTRLGFHHGFGLSVTLPRAVGRQRAAEMLLAGLPMDGSAALRCGLADRLVEPSHLFDEAYRLASDLAEAAPLGVSAARRTLRGNLAERVAQALVAEQREQEQLMLTQDFVEGVSAASERRRPKFVGS
jgi:2-(1,2-epoxy-1,2-dihydrophenyl)acetyl-CoA isomerase